VVRTLAKLHSLNIQSLNLESFGQATEFYERQLGVMIAVTNAQAKVKDRTTQQPVGPIPYSKELISFFENRQRHPRQMVSIVHGDFKMDNIVFHKTEPRVIGILE
jgi:aminoglycoside phosphotransferase (APT) family kinase protein